MVPTLLRGGWVLDAGCRDFDFARYAVAKGCQVLALDPSPDVEDPQIGGVIFEGAAVAGVAGKIRFAMTEDLEARHLATACSRGRAVSYVEVCAVTLADVMREHGVAMWDCVKMDIEGSEYEILKAWPGPIASQIAVEFHDHVERRPAEVYEEIEAHLGAWYTVVVRTAGDTLFVLKEHAVGLPLAIGAPWWRFDRGDKNVPWYGA